ncbi:MAG: hypothetical protein ACN6OP_09170 [Pseudomonadales bacterium]|uniref:SMODS-associating 2TM beta-strand rich effector domain-containing protein n=1 Tax=Achromobacter veterisilvae TaxID=2069367 RepID=A0A446CWN7_9BURK|nr:hypothetical protein [Achromobacter veterisilvae]SSW72276.1 hypothetical protein AVE30378_05011 [Achromobacter veterisilvae]
MLQLFDAIWPKLFSIGVGAIAVASWERLLHPLLIELFTEKTKLHPHFVSHLKWNDNDPHKLSMSIKKLGYGVTGTLRFLDGKHSGKEYALKGRYDHGLLTFTYVATDDRSKSQGSGTFKRTKDGEAFAGYFAYVSQSSGKIETVTSEFVKS